jgi:hydroxypyruvate reductase
LLERLNALRQEYGRVCLVSVGEVTVRLTVKSKTDGRDSMGGRNLHFALYSALKLRADDHVAVLSGGSDGVDGNSPAAGAVVDGAMVSKRREEAQKALADFDSFHFLHDEGATIMTGPTGNNLRDLRILLSDGS